MRENIAISTIKHEHKHELRGDETQKTGQTCTDRKHEDRKGKNHNIKYFLLGFQRFLFIYTRR
jgi:hypothetical protein